MDEFEWMIEDEHLNLKQDFLNTTLPNSVLVGKISQTVLVLNLITITSHHHPTTPHLGQT